MAKRWYRDPITGEWKYTDFQSIAPPQISAEAMLIEGASEDTKKKISDLLKEENNQKI